MVKNMIKQKNIITIRREPEILRGLYLDIETTGLSKSRSILTMIGCAIVTPDQTTLLQWFNNDAVSEENILRDFHEFLSTLNPEIPLITFNGDHFDLPYLRTHFSYHSISTNFLNQFKTVDLYKKLLPFQKAFSLEHGRQKDWEKVVNVNREDLYSGKELIGIYKNFLKTNNQFDADKIFLHNKEDILYLIKISSLHVFPSVLEDDWSIQDIKTQNGQELTVKIKIKNELPLSVKIGLENSTSFFFKDNHIICTLLYQEKEMKYYYSNYKDYYYLPKEDKAVHKSIGQYVDSSHRKKATASTCYTKKDSYFFHIPEPAKKYGLQILKETYNPYPTYREDYSDKINYISLDDLIPENGDLSTLEQYIKDLLKEVLINHKI